MTSSWHFVDFGELATVTRGASPRPIASARWFDTRSNVRWVRIADVNRSDGRRLSTTTQALSSDGIARSRFIEPGTLIMSIAATVGIPVITGVPACIHDGFVAIQNLKADQRFLFYLLKANEGKLREAGQSGSQMNINSEIVRGLKVWIPERRAEQQAIAQALWDADDSIDALIRLIAKKRDVKQGMMQELLTGRTRLPGFSGEWGKCALGGLIDGLVAGTSVRSVDGNTRPAVLKTSAVRGGHLDELEVKSILPEDISRARCTPVADSIIVSRMNTPAMVGEVGYVERALPDVYLPDRLWLARAPQGAGTNMRWLAALLSFGSTAESVRGLATGTSNSMKNIAKDRLLALRVPSPSTREQCAIGSVLADVDAEIAFLEHRLESARAVKVGMMQELLTGRTRLPVKEGA